MKKHKKEKSTMGKPKFYGWVNAAICFLIYFVSTGIASLTFSIYVVPITEHYQISRVVYSLASSLRGISGAVVYFSYGYLVKKVGLKRSILGGLFLVGIAYGVFAMGLGVASYFAASILAGIAGVFVSTVPLSQIIYNWFNDKRGLVLGIVYAASGTGGAIFSPILGTLLRRFGWQAPMALTAGLILLCILPVKFLLCETPAEKGMHPLGEKIMQTEQPLEGLSVGDALRSYPFWCLIAGSILAHFSVNATYNNVTPHLQALGFPLTFITGAIMVGMMVCNAAAKPFMGVVNDKFGSYAIVLLSSLFCVIGMFCISLFSAAGNQALTLIAVLFLGCGTTISTVVQAIQVQSILGPRNYSVFMGYVVAAGYIGSTIAPVFAGWVFDNNGTYGPAFLFCGATSLAAFALFTLARRRIK